MQPQKLCLKWNNHTTNLLTVLGGFQQRDILVDVTISCEGKNIKAHKMVLSACSPYFQNIFLENPCQHPIVIINGMRFEDITAILNFMYKGEVNVSQDELTSFLQAAEALKVKGLAEVCGEKKSTKPNSQDVQQNDSQNRPQRTDTPPRKRHRNRKRSLSDSNRSDDEGSSRKQHREPSSPEIHELSGDESFTGDTNSNGPPFNSVPRVPHNMYSRSHQSSSNMEDDDEFEVEPSKLLEQTLTTDNVSLNNSNVEKLRIERIMGNAELESSSLQEPESPPDIKPIIDYGDSSAGPSEGSMMLYNDQSQPGPSSLQDGSVLHDNAHAQDEPEINTTSRNKNYAHNTHTCETTQLLKELKDEPVCLCHLNETDLNESPNENEINKLLQKSGKKKSKRSKQLFIYNEKGCLKSIEVNKETNSVLHGLINCPPTKETLVATEDYISTNDSGQSTDSALERSISVNCQPSEYVTNSDTRKILNVPFIPQSYPNNTIEETVRKRKKRKGLKKKQSKKSNHIGNTSSINKKTQNDEGHSLPCAVVQEQSFTQFSVEEVHVAESSESVERPRRNRKWKSASEMLMLKRRIRKRIVQSTTSIKIQRREFKKQYCSNTESDLSLVCNSEERKKAIEQNNEKGLYKYRYRGYSRELEKYGPELLPPGWNLNVTKRKSGKTAGQLDIYFINPDGKRMRSKVELASYIEENGLPYSPEEFCFRKSAYKIIENSSV